MRSTFTKTITTGDFVAGATLRAKGRDLPLKMGDRLVYHRGWLVKVDLDPTFTAHPGVVGHNKALNNLSWKWGGQERYSLSGNGARMFERHEQGGKHSSVEAIQTVSASNRYFSRYIPNGPRNFANEDDFDTCVGNLQDAEFVCKLGALLDISADTTAAGGTVELIAVLTLSDDIHVAPWFERREETAGSGATLEGECLLAEVFLCDSVDYGAITAADYTALKVETGLFNVIDGEPAETLTEKYRQEWAIGQIDAIQGEPASSTDVNQRQVNLASPTAVAAQTADLQTVLSFGPGAKITGLPGYVRKNFKVSWTGAGAGTTVRCVGRFLPIDDSQVGRMVEEAARVCGVTPIPGQSRVKTLSRGNPGPMSRFMRRTTKVLRKAA